MNPYFNVQKSAQKQVFGSSLVCDHKHIYMHASSTYSLHSTNHCSLPVSPNVPACLQRFKLQGAVDKTLAT